MCPDPLMRDLVMLNNDNGSAVSIMSANDWAVSVLEPKLADAVPIEIIKLFEVARGSMLYGYFFYPLYTLALEQLYRVAEAAVTAKCDQISASNSAKVFKKKLDYLRKQKVMSDPVHAQWILIRELRNIACHPKQQTILPPGIVLGMLFQITDGVNRLFGSSEKTH